jgi:hypothetical protein
MQPLHGDGINAWSSRCKLKSYETTGIDFHGHIRCRDQKRGRRLGHAQPGAVIGVREKSDAVADDYIYGRNIDCLSISFKSEVHFGPCHVKFFSWDRVESVYLKFKTGRSLWVISIGERRAQIQDRLADPPVRDCV